MWIRSLLTLVTGASLVTATSHNRNPLRSIGRIEDPVIQTSTHRINALSHFNLDFDLRDADQRIRLLLEPNHDVATEETIVDHLNADGTIGWSNKLQRHAHKVYKGTARLHRPDGSWLPVGTARVTVRRDGPQPLFQGSFSVNHDYHHIQLRSSYIKNKQSRDPEVEDIGRDFMVFYRDSDIIKDARRTIGHTELKRSSQGYGCNASPISSKWDPLTGYYGDQAEDFFSSQSYSTSLSKRQDTFGTGNTGGVDLSTTIGQTAGCPSTKKVALVGIATDCGYTTNFNDDESDVNSNVIDVMNRASAVFESAFNISLGIQRIQVANGSCPGTPSPATPWNRACSDSYDIQTRLNDFSTWRNTLTDSNSHWTLLTSCSDGTAVGLAWVGSACTAPSAGGSGNQSFAGANVVALTGREEWEVVAHETGHTFGAVHDCDSDTCANSQYVASGQCCPMTASTCNANAQYIMNPYTTDATDTFSPCSIGNVCSGIGRNSVHTNCLSDNRAVQTITGQQCGNGIVEEGEECDCGDAEACADDPCCDGTTCKFASGAVCDDTNEDCCQACQFSAQGTVCRASTSSCDPQETCPGNTGICPADVTAPDGQDCSLNGTSGHVGQLQCASGQCTSRNLQCMSVMGTYTNGNNDTYACDDSSCTLRCGSPAFGANVCYEMQQNLLDGTVCGGGGHCSSGQCKGSEFGKEVGNWIDEHKGIVIGIAVAVGVLLLIAILSCCCSCFRRKRRRGVTNQGKMGPNPLNSGWYGPPPPPGPTHGPYPMQQEQRGMGGFNAPPPAYPSQQTWGHNPTGHGWRPPQSQPQSPSMHGAGLYGDGILGGRNSPVGRQLPWPQEPPQAYWGGPGSARYA